MGRCPLKSSALSACVLRVRECSTHTSQWPTRATRQSSSNITLSYGDGSTGSGDGIMLLRNDAQDEVKQHVAIADANSLYDSLRGNARGKESRVVIAVGQIKQRLNPTCCAVRWCARNEIVVDPLAKGARKTSLRPLLCLMKTGMHRLGGELEEADYRLQEHAQRRSLKLLKGKRTEYPGTIDGAPSY